MESRKNIKKILAVILSAIMLLSVVPMSVFAEESSDVAVATAANGTVTWYSDLALAFDAAQYQDITVKLLKNVDEVHGTNGSDKGIKLSEGGNVILDLNGHSITKYNSYGTTNNYAFFYVTGNTKLTVKDSVGGGSINQPIQQPAFIVDKNASLTIEGGTITNSRSAGIRVDSGTLTVSGGAIESYGAGIQVGGGTVTVTGNPKIHGRKSNALLINGTSTVTLSGGRYTTEESDGHSIWATVGKVEDLLVEGYRYTDSNGNSIEVISNQYGSGTDCADVSVSDFGIKYKPRNFGRGRRQDGTLHGI